MPQFWTQTDRQHSRKISKDKLLSLSKLARAFWEKHPSQMRRANSGQYGRAHTRGHILPRALPSVWQNDPAISRSSGFWRSSSKSRTAYLFESRSQFSRSVSVVFLVIRPISAKKGCRPARTFDSSQTLLRNATRVICLRYAREFQYQP